MTEVGGLGEEVERLERELAGCRSALTRENQLRRTAEYEAGRWEGQWRAMKSERDDYQAKFMKCVTERGETEVIAAELSRCRLELGVYKAQVGKVLEELRGVRAVLDALRQSAGRGVADLASCVARRSELEKQVVTLEAEVEAALETRARWVASWLWGVVPSSVLRSLSKERMIEWLVLQPIAAVQRKWALWEFCKRAGIKLLGRDVAKVTGRPAGTL